MLLSFLLFLVTVFMLGWYLWRSYSPYFAFPIYVFDLKFIFALLVEKGLKNVPLADFLVQNYFHVCEQYKKEGMFVFWFLKPVIVVFGPEPYKFFSNEPSCTDKPAWLYRFFTVFGENGIFRSNGDRMRKQRKLFRQAFYPSMLKANISAINVHAASLIQKLMQLKDNTTDDLEELIKHCILMSVFDAILGINSDTPEKERRMKTFLKLATEWMSFVVHRGFRPWLHPYFMLRFFSAGRYFLKVEKDFFNCTMQVVEDLKESYNSRIKLMKKDDLSYKKKKKIFGDILIDHYLKDPSFTLDDLRTEIATLIIGATDTAADSITWTFWLLGHYQDIQEKAYEEVKSLDEVILYEDTLKLTYLECVIKESLRCYPTCPFFVRQASEDLQYGKYTIPKGTTIGMVPYVLHKNSDIYPEPDTFNPDRFAENKSDIKPWTHVAFAEGARSCVGKNYAMLEMKILMAYILRKFKLVSQNSLEEVGLSWGVTLRSSIPISMKFIPRHS